jgi:hypothetical protein
MLLHLLHHKALVVVAAQLLAQAIWQLHRLLADFHLPGQHLVLVGDSVETDSCKILPAC